jgi:hypothetical protein
MKSPANRNKVILTAGLFCAITATVISAALVTIFLAAPNRAFTNGKEMVETFLAMCLFTAIPAGSFGLLAGITGGMWLSMRAKHFRSRKHLLAESACVGLVLSIVFPFFHWAMGWSDDRSKHVFDIKEIAFSISVGLPSAVMFALFYGHLLHVVRPQPSSPKTAE